MFTVWEIYKSENESMSCAIKDFCLQSAIYLGKFLSFLSLRSLAFKNGMIIPTWSGCKKSNEVTITKFLALRTERINTFNIILFFISFTIHIFYSHFFLLRIHHFDIFSFVWITAKSPSLYSCESHSLTII